MYKTSNTQYEDLSSGSNLEPVNLKYMMYSVVIIYIPANGAMIFFQLRSLKPFIVIKEWWYNIPYGLMWILIIFYINAARILIDKAEMDDNRNRLTTFKPVERNFILVDSQHDSTTCILAFGICHMWFYFKPTKSFTLLHDYNCYHNLFSCIGGSNHKTYMYCICNL